MDFISGLIGILSKIWVMSTNIGIVAFLTNNAILIGMFFVLANGLARSTPWGWDNILVRIFRNALTFAKPDFPLPEEEIEEEKE